jgi:hypothetical protein
MSKRPIRDASERTTDKIPSGPLGYGGNGNLLGGAGYFAVATLNGIIPIQGVNIGYNVESHEVRRRGNSETHTFVINAMNKNIAQFVAKFQSTPSNLDLPAREIEITDITKLKERRTATTWRIETEARKRETK